MPRLLLVESDRSVQRTLQRLFAADEYFCAVAADGLEARLALGREVFDLIVLDLGGRRSEGLDVLRGLRSRHHTPVLLLCSQDGVEERLAGLEAGADDCLGFPSDPRELRARVRAQLRRAGVYSRPETDRNRIELGEISVDAERRDAFRDGCPLRLTNREFDLLHLLARHRNAALASTWIFESVWGYSPDSGIKALTVYVGRLRRKIEADALHPRILVNVRGFGYQVVSQPPPPGASPVGSVRPPQATGLRR